MSRCAVLAVRADQIPLSPGTRTFFEPLMLFFPPPFLSTRRPSPRRTITYENQAFGPGLNHYPLDVISQQPENFRSSTVLTRCYSRLLTSFLRHPIQESHDSLH